MLRPDLAQSNLDLLRDAWLRTHDLRYDLRVLDGYLARSGPRLPPGVLRRLLLEVTELADLNRSRLRKIWDNLDADEPPDQD
jgi:hypothetical protein